MYWVGVWCVLGGDGDQRSFYNYWNIGQLEKEVNILLLKLSSVVNRSCIEVYPLHPQDAIQLDRNIRDG